MFRYILLNFSADLLKPSQATNEITPFGIRGERDLGTFGGIKASNDVSVDLGNIIGPQGVGISVKPAEQSAKVEIELGAKKGFGVEFGIEIQRTPTGISTKDISFGVNVLGFGVNAEGKGNESSKLGVSAGGFELEIASDKDGGTSIRLGFCIPGICTGITLQPDGKKEEKTISTPQGLPNDGSFGSSDLPQFNPRCIYSVSILCLEDGIEFINCLGYGSNESSQGWSFEKEQPAPGIYGAFGKRTKHPYRDYYVYEIDIFPAPVGFVEIRRLGGSRPVVKGNLIKGAGPWYRDDAPILKSSITAPGAAMYSDYWTARHGMSAKQAAEFGANFMNEWPMRGYPNYRIKIDQKCPGDADYKVVVPNNLVSNPLVPQNLPNQPQHYKPMNCCDKVEEIYKYLGIAKMKKHKFKVAKQFLIPGGKGNEECEDYYTLSEALFRMLANGLIINPISKPLGSDWQSVNATSWASQMYEMLAEAMSDGNSTQRYEISAMMQMVQMMALLAETSRKVEFLADALGKEPVLVRENVPVCFTIYEGHKGFEKKEPKQIDVSGAKTDDDVEKILGKMLKPSKIPVTKWQFNPSNKTLSEDILNG